VEVPLAVLVDPLDQIVGRAGVERPVALAGDDVGEERQPEPPYATKELGPGFRRDERNSYTAWLGPPTVERSRQASRSWQTSSGVRSRYAGKWPSASVSERDTLNEAIPRSAALASGFKT